LAVRHGVGGHFSGANRHIIMLSLTLFFQNPFAVRQYGIGRLRTFTTDHLGRLRAANLDGNWPARIAATETALATFNGQDSAHGSAEGVRKTSKLELRAFRRALTSRLGDLYLALQVKYGVRSAMLKTFFPHGRTYFARCKDDILEPSLKALVAAVTNHAAELGPELVAQASALVSDWQPLHVASETSGGAMFTAELNRREARAALVRELYLNLLALAQDYPDQPEKLSSFMQQSLLTQKRRSVAA
jgi:hypothetical protein